MKNLVPGSQYDFEVYVSSVCGKSSSAYVDVETRIEGRHFLETDRNQFCVHFMRNETVFCILMALEVNYLESCDAIQSEFVTGRYKHVQARQTN